MRCTNWGPAHLLLSRVGHCMAFGFSLHGSTRLCLWHSFEPPANQEYVALGHDMLCGFSVLAFGENHQDAPLFGDTIIYWDLFALVLRVTTVFFSNKYCATQLALDSFYWTLQLVELVELKAVGHFANEMLFWSEMPYCFPGLIFQASWHGQQL